MKIDLTKQNQQGYEIGKSKFINYLWYLTSSIFFVSPYFPFYGLKIFILKIFGANIGDGVVIKPRVTIKFPWKLSIGNYSTIGECAWIDNLDSVKIGSNVCISQSVYICTGSHNYKIDSFDLIIKPVTIEDGVWLGAGSTVLQGVTCFENSILSAGSVASQNMQASKIYQGNPALELKERKFN